jgi:hypothetical protein
MPSSLLQPTRARRRAGSDEPRQARPDRSLPTNCKPAPLPPGASRGATARPPAIDCRCQRPSVSAQWRPSVLPSGGRRFSPVAAMSCPRWWPSVLPVGYSSILTANSSTRGLAHTDIAKPTPACPKLRRGNTSVWRCSGVCAVAATGSPTVRRACAVSRRVAGGAYTNHRESAGTTPPGPSAAPGCRGGVRRPPPGWRRARGSRPRPACARRCRAAQA